MYYTYMLRCADNSIYTGITVDLDRRLYEHKQKTEKCAKYTLNHEVIKLEVAWISKDRVLAAKLEYRIKKLNKFQKEELIKNNNMEELFKEKIDSSEYERV